MEKPLGYRMLDELKEIGNFEVVIAQVESAIYSKKVENKVEEQLKLFGETLEAQATVYGVNTENYKSRIDELKNKYLEKIVKVKDEYAFQYINMQLELREVLTKQKIAIANAKKMYELKKEYIESVNKQMTNINGNMLLEVNGRIREYENKKMVYIKKYYDYNSIINKCEAKINKSLEDALTEIESVGSKNIEKAVLVKKETGLSKLISKISNLFTGKSKFEEKIANVEQDIGQENQEIVTRVDEIRNKTIEMVADVQTQKNQIDSASIV